MGLDPAAAAATPVKKKSPAQRSWAKFKIGAGQDPDDGEPIDIMTWISILEGDFLDGKRHGPGKLTTASGATFVEAKSIIGSALIHRTGRYRKQTRTRVHRVCGGRTSCVFGFDP